MFKGSPVIPDIHNSYNNFTPSAHPYSMFHTTNIDMETGKELLLADLVPTVDEAFAEAVKNGAYKGEFDKEAVTAYLPRLRDSMERILADNQEIGRR